MSEIGRRNFRIAISGKANSGKNTAASMLAEHLKFENSKYKIVALADPLKNILKIMFPEATDECLFGESHLRANIISKNTYLDVDGNPLTYRKALTDLGAFGRKYNPDIWLNALVADAKKSEDINVYIASDLRMLNEFDALKKAGFILIRILRNNHTKINDPSELEQEKIPNSSFHYVIDNNGTIDEFNTKIYEIAKDLMHNNGQ